jgi:hypothetical protein
VRKDIQEFAKTVEKVVILWTANTEKSFLNAPETAADLLKMVEANTPLPASMLYAVAAI